MLLVLKVDLSVGPSDLLWFRHWAAVALLLSITPSLLGQDAILPGTKPWNFPQDIVAEQYQELRAYYERLIAEAARKRELLKPDREEFRRMIGAVDQMQLPKPKEEAVGQTPDYSVSLVEWPVLRLGTIRPTMAGGFQVREYGILLVPRGSGPFPATIAIADATCSAADIAGLTPRLPGVWFCSKIDWKPETRPLGS